MYIEETRDMSFGKDAEVDYAVIVWSAEEDNFKKIEATFKELFSLYSKKVYISEIRSDGAINLNLHATLTLDENTEKSMDLFIGSLKKMGGTVKDEIPKLELPQAENDLKVIRLSDYYKADNICDARWLRGQILTPALVEAIRYGKYVIVDLESERPCDNAYLNQVFGGLTKTDGFEAEDVLKVMKICSMDNPVLEDKIKEYVLNGERSTWTTIISDNPDVKRGKNKVW